MREGLVSELKLKDISDDANEGTILEGVGE